MSHDHHQEHDHNHGYRPLNEVKKDLRVEWYRCQLDNKTLRELSARSDAQGWFQAGGHFGLFLIAAITAFYFWSQQNWLAFIIALFCQGVVACFYKGTAPHELGHGSVFKSKRLNKIFLYIVSFIGWWDPFDYASSHTFHHRYTLHPEGDRENLLPLSPMVGRFFLFQLLTVKHNQVVPLVKVDLFQRLFTLLVQPLAKLVLQISQAMNGLKHYTKHNLNSTRRSQSGGHEYC